MENISDRLAKIVQNEGISVRSFEERIGCSNGVLAKSIAKGTNISTLWMSKIIEMMPKYNAAWLLTGKGEMIKEIEVHSTKEPEEYDTSPPPCEKCKIKDELIESLKREVDTLAHFNKHLIEANSPIPEGKKRKESSSGYGNSKLSEAV